MSEPSNYAGILNRLDAMQQAPCYAMARSDLALAESTIVQLERLNNEHEMFRHQHRDCDAMGVENQQLRQRVKDLESWQESLQKDADRYRWLKATSFGGEHDHFMIFGNDPETGDSYPLGGDELDALIDRDMQPPPHEVMQHE